MKMKKINLNFHYIPINKFYIFKKRFKKNIFLNTEKYYQEAVSLPLHPKLDSKSIKYVANNLIKILERI